MTDVGEIQFPISFRRALECMDFAVYEPLHAEETVKAQFHAEALERSDVIEFPGDHGGAERFALRISAETQITGLERMEEIRIYSQAQIDAAGFERAPKP